MPVPEGFDYPLWLGPAPDAPYHVDRCLYRFRFILDYSGGQTTNFGATATTSPNGEAATTHTVPVEYENLGCANGSSRVRSSHVATKVDFRARYANGVELHCVTAAPYFGCRFEGTEGWIQFDSGGMTDASQIVERFRHRAR